MRRHVGLFARHWLSVLCISFTAALCCYQSATLAQTSPPPAQALSRAWYNDKVEVELRLKGPATTTNASPTIRVATIRFANVNARYFEHVWPCWNTASSCPQVTGVTARIYLKLPWTGRVNVTRYILCNGTECSLPNFPAIAAKPGEVYALSYDRIKAVWRVTPYITIPAEPKKVS